MDGFGIFTDGSESLNGLSFLLPRRYSFSSLLKSAILTRSHESRFTILIFVVYTLTHDSLDDVENLE